MHYVHQERKEAKDNLAGMAKMDFLEIEVLQEAEVYKVKLEKMDLRECLDLKDQWVSLATLGDLEQKETKEKMQFINHCLGHQDQEEKEGTLDYQE